MVASVRQRRVWAAEVVRGMTLLTRDGERLTVASAAVHWASTRGRGGGSNWCCTTPGRGRSCGGS